MDTVGSHNMKYVFQFGKYRGHTVAAVAQANPQYLIWLHYNTRIFELTPELLRKVELSVHDGAYVQQAEGDLHAER